MIKVVVLRNRFGRFLNYFLLFQSWKKNKKGEENEEMKEHIYIMYDMDVDGVQLGRVNG